MSQITQTTDALSQRIVEAQPVVFRAPGGPQTPSTRSELAVLDQGQREVEARPLVVVGPRQPVLVDEQGRMQRPDGTGVASGGIVPWDLTGSEIQRVVNSIESSGKRGFVSLAPGETYELGSTPLVFTTGVCGMRGHASVLNSTLEGVFSITLRNRQTSPFSRFAPLTEYSGFSLMMPKTTDKTFSGDGIFVGRTTGTSGEAAHTVMRDVYVFGGRDSIKFGDQSWLNQHFNCHFQQSWRYGGHFETLTNAGENHNFHGGVFAGVNNNDGTGVGIYMPGQGNAGVNLHGVSIDYCDFLAWVESGVLSGSPHLENRGSQPMIVLSPVTGQQPSLLLNGARFAPTEDAPGRASLIRVANGTSQNASVLVKQSHLELWGRTTEVLTLDNPALPILRADVSDNHYIIQAGGSTMARLGASLNQLHNGDFAAGTMAGWSNSALTPYTLGVNATGGIGGTQSARVVGTGSGNMNFFQDVPVRPGQQVIFDGNINITDRSAGQIFVRMRFLDATGKNSAAPTVISSFDHQSWSATTGGYQRFAGRYTAPRGACFARLDVFFLAFGGTADFDDFDVWIN